MAPTKPQNKTSLIIATRRSPLALWQAQWVKSALEKAWPQLTVELLRITTTADKMLNVPLRMIGGKDLFVKELEEALLDGRADLAVHSMKDVPTQLPAGLSLPVVCERADPRDAWVSNEFAHIADLPVGAKIGTSSLRRQSQLYALRGDLKCVPVRGNVGTRLSRLDQGEFAGLVLAGAGLQRLNLQARITAWLAVEESLPAPGQGALGLECRIDDELVQSYIQPLNHFNSFACVMAERALCQKLGAGCQVPLGAYADIVDQTIRLRGLVAWPDGHALLRAEQTCRLAESGGLGATVADYLLAQGAGKILNSLDT